MGRNLISKNKQVHSLHVYIRCGAVVVVIANHYATDAVPDQLEHYTEIFVDRQTTTTYLQHRNKKVKIKQTTTTYPQHRNKKSR